MLLYSSGRCSVQAFFNEFEYSADMGMSVDSERGGPTRAGPHQALIEGGVACRNLASACASALRSFKVYLRVLARRNT
jgi:hypothetical protein